MTPLPRDSYVASPASSRARSLGRTALLVGLGVAALAGPAWASGPAVAQEPPPPSVSTPTPAPPAPSRFSLCPDPAHDRDSTQVQPRGDDEISTSSASDRPIGQAPQGSRLEVHLVNDSFKDPLNLFGSSHKQPGTSNQDDDGFTAEARIDYSCTRGDRQWVLSARGQILTERGAWERGPDYQGRRADILDLTYQVNRRQSLSEDGRTVLSYGAGGGLQLVGDLGGREVQEFVHRYGPFGGRLAEDGLQYNYTSQDVTVTPVVTGGVKGLRALDDEARLNIKGELGAFMPLGPGLGAVQAVAGVE
ncbi:MAG TPA: hypothetical protein VNO81_13515, partial [Candidatus Nitrosotenuis sp.]|nr:hypothetical protein [Candidatus Nitrosotenuis sp.]